MAEPCRGIGVRAGGDEDFAPPRHFGRSSRRELSELLAINFPALARANNCGMKWKKFLYRELSQREGIYVCASPRCNACADYALCFGPEG